MFEFTRNFYSPAEESSESSFAPGQIIIPEQTVETEADTGGIFGAIICEYQIGPDVLSIIFDGIEYVVSKHGIKYASPKSKSGSSDDAFVYGEMDMGRLSFNNYPFCITYSKGSVPGILSGWNIFTPTEGTYTISAKVPEEKPTPKVLSFPKGRTVVSELSRLNKVFGTVSAKKTIIGQLSDLAEAAEAGKIGGGSGGAFMVHVSVNDLSNLVMDKTWQEIHDALKTTSVYIDNEAEMSVSAVRIIAAGGGKGVYWVRSETSDEFETNSSDGYPTSSSNNNN